MTSNVAGCVTPATPLDEIQVTRNEINVDSVETALDDQMDATFQFNTGFVEHTLVAGLEGIRDTSDPSRDTITSVPTTSLLNPNESQPYAGVSTLSSQVQVTAITFGTYVLDTLQLGSKFDLIGGGRWDRFDANYNQYIAPASAFNQTVGLPSWRGALVYKPRPNGSIYFDAGNSFDPSAETLSLSAATANTPPEKNLDLRSRQQVGFGLKKLSAVGSIFRTDQTNAREPETTNQLLDVHGARSANRVQLAFRGHSSVSLTPPSDGPLCCQLRPPGRTTIRSQFARSPPMCPAIRSISGRPTGFRGEIFNSARVAIS